MKGGRTLEAQSARSIILWLRETKGLKQKDLAKKAGIANATLSDIEAGKKIPSLITLQKIANAFSMDLKEFLSLNPSKSNSVDNCTNNNVDNLENKIILEWANNPDNIKYIELIYRLSKQIPTEMIDRVKFFIDIQSDFTNGGNKHD